MQADGFPTWTLAPFPAVVLAVVALPALAPRTWEKWSTQAAVLGACALPALVYLAARRPAALGHAAAEYAAFVATIGALFVVTGGVRVTGDVRGTPAANVALVFAGSVLASVIGTTGASLLLVRPLLAANRRRRNVEHVVPLFIVAAANAGGLLTPLGDPPLLMGYVAGVPFFWTLRLFPAWVLYVGWTLGVLFVIDRRSYAREAAAARPAPAPVPVRVEGGASIVLLFAVAPAALLPAGYREAAMIALAIASLALTPRALREANAFRWAPIVEVAILFAALFATLPPVEDAVARAAPALPLHSAVSLFWTTGLLSGVLDNAPTYAVFAALSGGASVKLAAVSVGAVVMGAATYIGNGPNLMVRAVARAERFPTPTFARYAAFAFAVLLPPHLVTTLALVLLDR